MKRGLYDKLKDYSNSDFYPFHMPGHKRSTNSGGLSNAYKYDITEIDGFDNLHQPEGILKEAQERAARLYQSEETYFLINGSTAGILSAVSAVAKRAKNLIIARNCHKAVYHAAFLNRLSLHYVYPELLEGYDIAGGVTSSEIEKKIKEILSSKNAGAKEAGELVAGIVLTSPTYEGISSDIEEISSMVHGYGIPLIVDQAHGAHFGMHPAYPESAVRLGADIVIHSIHKTLPAPTQTALIHRNGSLADKDMLQKYLRIYQSSSPSYLLMAGIDEAVRLAASEGYQRLDKLLSMRELFLKKAAVCRHIWVCSLTEPGKLVICVRDCLLSGQKLYNILREKYHLQMEMASGSYVVAIVTMMDEACGFDRLAQALLEIDKGLEYGYVNGRDAFQDVIYGNGGSSKDSRKSNEKKMPCIYGTNLSAVVALDLWEAYTSPYENVELAKAQGRIAAEFVNLYPPGIPLLAPGEIVSDEIISVVRRYIAGGYLVQGLHDKKIKVVR